VCICVRSARFQQLFVSSVGLNVQVKNIACASSATGSFLEYAFFNEIGQVSAGGDLAAFAHDHIFSGCHVSDELFSGVKETVDRLPLSFVRYCLLVHLPEAVFLHQGIDCPQCFLHR